jgi:hypothetical protein
LSTTFDPSTPVPPITTIFMVFLSEDSCGYATFAQCKLNPGVTSPLDVAKLEISDHGLAGLMMTKRITFARRGVPGQISLGGRADAHTVRTVPSATSR